MSDHASGQGPTHVPERLLVISDDLQDSLRMGPVRRRTAAKTGPAIALSQGWDSLTIEDFQHIEIVPDAAGARPTIFATTGLSRTQDGGVPSSRSSVAHGTQGVITLVTVEDIIGVDAVDAVGDKIGSVSEVYLDDQSGRPEWATVKTGMFGTKETFIPLAQAQLSGDSLQFPYDKAKVKEAPTVDTEGYLSPEEESELYRYYGIASEPAVESTGVASPAITQRADPGDV